MGKLTPAITGKLVAFESAPLIYYFEEHVNYLAAADELFNAIHLGLARGMTSVLTRFWKYLSNHCAPVDAT